MINISQINIEKCKSNEHWDFGNAILYKLCEDHFQHVHDDIIITKTLFIGRIYAAAIERRKNKALSNSKNDDFYVNEVARALRTSTLDSHLAKLKHLQLTVDNIPKILKAHNDLQSTLSKITDLNKRSFCSKYLHFHLPDLYFIYDSRALKALSVHTPRVPKELRQIPLSTFVDKEYATFFCKCVDLKNRIEAEHKTTLSPRQMDNMLIM